MKRVYKYPLIHGEQSLIMPDGARPLYADMQDGAANLWAEVDTENARCETRFLLAGTGRELPRGARHVSTFQAPPFVWHLYVLP